MNFKLLILIIPILIITSYIILVSFKITERFLTNADDPITQSDAFKMYSIDPNKYYEKLQQEARAPVVDYNIQDAVGDANIAYALNIYSKPLPSSAEDMQQNNNWEYTIISQYRRVLGRSPSTEEIEQHMQQYLDKEIDENTLKIYLLNSSEYALNAKLQSNDINEELEYTYAKEDMFLMIAKMYFNELKKEPPRIMLLPLRDVFMMLGNDKYLFRAFLIHFNYQNFENDLINTKGMKKENIIQLFNKHFVYDEIRMKANDIKRYDALNRVQNDNAPPPTSIPTNTAFQGTQLQNLDSTQESINKKLEELQKKYGNNIVENFEVTPAEKQLAMIQSQVVIKSDENKLRDAIAIQAEKVAANTKKMEQVSKEISKLKKDIDTSDKKLIHQEAKYKEVVNKITKIKQSCRFKADTNIVVEVLQYVEEQKNLVSAQQKALELKEILNKAIPQIEKWRIEHNQDADKLAKMKQELLEYDKIKEVTESERLNGLIEANQFEKQKEIERLNKLIVYQGNLLDSNLTRISHL
jgi:hypothetical protein